jgi:DNA-binding LytR/AlgR family response regulator
VEDIRKRCQKTIERLCLKQKGTGKVGKYIMDKLNNIEKSLNQSEEKFAVWENEQIYLLKPSDILYLTVEESSVLLFSKQGKFLSKHSLEIWEGKLAAYNFFRCHRGFSIKQK